MTAPPQRRPPPAGPRIPPDVLDPVDQRTYALAAFALLQAYKLADALQHSAPPPAFDDDHPLNPQLLKWVALDLLAVLLIAYFRIPRLDWGWKARYALYVTLGLVDYALFGHWTFAASFFLPSFVKCVITRTMSTAERSVRLSTVYGSEKSHLGGQFTVHILAVSTAFLNPLSTVYCRHRQSSKSDPTLIPLVLNNTIPSKLTYSLTTFDDPPVTTQHTISASALVRHHSSHHLPHHRRHGGRRDAISNAEDDDLALASEWALVPSSSSPSSASQPRHRLPDSSAPSSATEENDPFHLSATESLYYLPLTQLGHVQLESILDTDGHPVRIRRKRSPTAAAGATGAEAYESTRILRCPTAGFDLGAAEREEHRCLLGAAAGEAESFPLGLVVSGQAQPLRVRWHSREGDAERGLRRDEALEGIVGEDGSEVVPVPMNVSLSRPGRTTYYLDSVVDGVGNEVAYFGGTSPSSSSSSSGTATKAPLVDGTVPSRSVVVHSPPEVQFVGACGKAGRGGGDEPVRLLRGRKTKLQVLLSSLDKDAEGANEVEIRFRPESEEDGGKTGWTRKVETRGPRAEMEVGEPGTYEIVGVRSRWCGGAVLVPNTCTVVLQPVPTVTSTFSPLTDVCSSEIGLVSTLHFTGAAPFVVHYTISGRSSSGRPYTKTSSKRVTHARDEIKLEAPGPGEYEYRFVKVEDKYYKDIRLDGAEYATKQTVHERGDARWRNAKEGKTVHSCEGETVQVELELSGTAPWDVEYSIVGQRPQLLKGITTSPHALEVSIPPQIAKHGGEFALSLESVRDGNGCKRPLAVEDRAVEVRRTKPTARFHGAEGKRSVTLRAGEKAKIPLRLTGESPWTVTYQPPSPDGTPGRPVTIRAQQANVDINIENAVPGQYKLLSVRDQHCPGDVFETDWSISTLPRPTLRLGDNLGKVARNGSVIRPGVCANTPDSVPVFFGGKAPFKAAYTLVKGSHHGGEKREHSLQAIQSRAELTLFTAQPGHHTYTFTGVADSLYSTPDANGLVAPGSGGKAGLVRLEQDVYALPTAYFAHGPKHGFCVNDDLASRSGDDLVLHLTGAAPFEVELEVREEAHKAAAKSFVVPSIDGHSWPISLPYALTKAAPYSLAIKRVKDAHGCETLVAASPSAAPADAAAADALVVSGATVQSSGRTAVTLPVAEIATIQAVSPQVDHCVGDFLDFVVQGQPPFTVVTEFEGKRNAVPLTSGKFQRVAAKPGTFKVVSVGHGESQCRSKEVDIVKQIHPLPSARVLTGDSFVVDLREGEQTEIIFAFEGTPPFSFTYSRRAPQDRSKDRTVLETHTVTGIQEPQYSILTSQEGTWSVSYVADKYCAYPPRRESAVVKS
ncbi:hypothetical protein JCM8097_009503 [Rhodosporidiobolus ruineniae]